jgi:hypothetical protein
MLPKTGRENTHQAPVVYLNPTRSAFEDLLFRPVVGGKHWPVLADNVHGYILNDTVYDSLAEETR